MDLEYGWKGLPCHVEAEQLKGTICLFLIMYTARLRK